MKMRRIFRHIEDVDEARTTFVQIAQRSVCDG